MELIFLFVCLFRFFSKSNTVFSEKQVLAFVILYFRATCQWQKAFFLSYLEGITTYHQGISVKTGVLSRPDNPSTQDAETGGLQVADYLDVRVRDSDQNNML